MSSLQERCERISITTREVRQELDWDSSDSEGEDDEVVGVAPVQYDAACIKLCNTTWKKVAKLLPDWHVLFFGLLFELAPSAKQLFSFDVGDKKAMKVHVKHVQHAIEQALAGLRSYDHLVPVLRDLGARHGKYGVEPSAVDLFAQALLTTLQRGLGKKWTPSQQEAWTYVVRLIGRPFRQGIESVMAEKTQKVIPPRAQSFSAPTHTHAAPSNLASSYSTGTLASSMASSQLRLSRYPNITTI
eukprot:m.359068 g.359068  ORF g.359068 m.359068 type:complete len:244 (+) comp18397_c0_seq1:443-1174(+)